MFRRLTMSLVAGLALVAAACSAPKEDEAMTRGLFQTLQAGDFNTIQAHLAADLQTPAALPELTRMRSLIPPVPPQSVDTEGWSKTTNLQGTRIETHHRYTYADRALLVDTALFTPKGGQVIIETFKVTPVTPNGAPQINPFAPQSTASR